MKKENRLHQGIYPEPPIDLLMSMKKHARIFSLNKMAHL